MTLRRPKLPVAFRIAGPVMAAFWLLAASYCSVEQLLGCDEHETATAGREHAHLGVPAQAGHLREGAVAHSHDADELPSDAEGQPQGSHHHHSGEVTCCSTLHATVQMDTPIVVAKPLLQPLTLFNDLLLAPDDTLAALAKASDRPPPDRDRVFTPEVRTGPANRSQAPPAFL